MISFRHVPRLIMVALLSVLMSQFAAAEDRSPLMFTQTDNTLLFDTGVLKGRLGKEDGKLTGIGPVVHNATGTQLAGEYGILSAYRMLATNARFGIVAENQFTAAWDWAATKTVQSDGAVRVSWLPDKDHPWEMTGVYRWVAANTLDFELTVKPERNLQKFELFVASYFNGFSSVRAYMQQPAPGTTATVSGQFVEVVKADGVWQMFPRDAASAALIDDGRWTCPPHPVKWVIRPCYAAPIILRRDASTGLTAVLMSRPDDCFAISTPHGEESHRAAYFSLFGRDIEAGKAVTASVRIVIGKDITDQQAIELYRNFCTAGGRK